VKEREKKKEREKEKERERETSKEGGVRIDWSFVSKQSKKYIN